MGRPLSAPGRLASSIPLRRPLSRQGSTSSTACSDATHRWKQKLEESEERRKLLLSDKEKALRSLQEVERRHLQLQERHEQLETELFEKNEEFTRLSTASKNLYKEYETLKHQYETETVMEFRVDWVTAALIGCRALKDATQWYKENRQLRRRTLMLPPDQDAVDEGVDAGGDADIDNLNKTIKQLSAEVAELQTELDGVRQTEFQTLEQNAKLCEELEAAQQDRARLEAALATLRHDHAQLLRVSDLMRKELEELREVRNAQRNDIVQLR
ncbi:hypothetical protein D910_04050 [Dendroctonus ponderosae]|uniref:Uncharacterized protein n=1 Tax=Dendroctonus ponderosae TaxID=77166 RepID=U4TYD2_DENPD|nr:hypothetical protein D910_04050 [Dendroctonus ponderosae]